MEKNVLGRGLEDISSIFMTPEKNSGSLNKAPDLSASSKKKSCTDCVNYLEKPQEAPRCKKFSFKYGNDGVPEVESIMPGFAKQCCYFHPVESDKNDRAVKLSFEKPSEEEISFNTEIEETINTHKKISISDNGDSQYGFKKMFSQYLENGYEVIRIDFKKKEEHIDSYHRTIKQEEVTIVTKHDAFG
jgi:hypothetical protein